jgi:hypothetical protein
VLQAGCMKLTLLLSTIQVSNDSEEISIRKVVSFISTEKDSDANLTTASVMKFMTPKSTENKAITSNGFSFFK